MGIVGAVVLVAAMVGIFWYEGTRGGAGAERFTVTSWGETSINGPQLSGTTDEGATAQETVLVNQRNLKSVEFCLVWADDVGGPDELAITVTPPEGLGLNASGDGASDSNGEVCVPFGSDDAPLNPAPTLTAVAADDEADAKRRLGEQSGNTRGIGTWNVTVEVVSAGDQTTPIPQAPPIAQDPGQAWQVKVVYHVHEPTFG